MKRPARPVFSVLLALALTSAAAGCRENDDSGGSGDRPELVVSAAASLTDAFEAYGERFDSAEARFSFAGSDELAAQIRQSVKPDVYAAASAELPEQLFEEGKLERPRVFASNRLVIAVESDADGIDSIGDLERPGLQLAIGSKSVPVGAYAREVLDRLPTARRQAILDNVASEEPDVSGVVGKLTQGAADAGLLYITDVASANGRLKAIELPERLRPTVEYGIAVVRGAKQHLQAQRFIEGLISGAGLEKLRKAGFEPPPR